MGLTENFLKNALGLEKKVFSQTAQYTVGGDVSEVTPKQASPQINNGSREGFNNSL